MYLITAYVNRLTPRSRCSVALTLAGLAVLTLLMTGLASPSAHAASVARPATARPATGPKGAVDVISAGSLKTLMAKIAPLFHKDTGYTLVDTSGGSSSDAADIKNGVYVEDVFVSASPKVDSTLEGKQNGSWVSWYADFAASPEVLGYNPKSMFAADLKTMPWYKVITMSGFRLGRTDPSQDPGGVLAKEALEETAAKQPAYAKALRKLATESSDVYSEDTEEADIQTGQLDASFMYEADANSQDSPFVKLTGTDLAGDYTITQLKNAPHPGGAAAFIKFLLGPRGQAAMKADHFEIVSPAKVTGSGVPSVLKPLLK
jgi:molybdate/tungstate transport system substrate-binding protein